MPNSSDNPIICGRRNCSKCTRWRLVTDFKWRWPKRRTTVDVTSGLKSRGLKSRRKDPQISTVCNVCARAGERERYHNLTEEERLHRVHKAVQNAKAQRRLLKDQIHYAKLAQSRRKRRWDENEVDLTPFRMWLLGRVRANGPPGLRGLASEVGVDEKQLRRWADGYDWDYEIGQAWAGCEPRPIHSIRPSTVDRIGLGLGEPDLLNRLYPWVDKEDA